MLITVPYLQTIFSFNNPGLSHFVNSIIAASIVLLTLEIIKYSRLKLSTKNSTNNK